MSLVEPQIGSEPSSIKGLVTPLAHEFQGRVDIDTVSLGCGVWYLDLRFAGLGWRPSHPGIAEWAAFFAERDSKRATWLL